MARSSNYNHYLQRVDIDGQTIINIEEEFDGLLYSKAEGINTIGKVKNIYTEEYADSDRKRYFLPPDNNYTNESTVVTMTFIVCGTPTDRQKTINAFLEYIRKGVHRYWDDARNREFDFIVLDNIQVSDEQWYGKYPYVELQIPLQNLNGSTSIHQS